MPSLFISDLHLNEERPEANERFIAFLEEKARAAEALYILGDFFEYWIGDDDLAEPFNAVIAGLLQDLTRRGVPVRLMHGNRDFLIGEGFCAATGAKLLDDPAVEEHQGEKTLLVHGDTLCTDDVEYQAWRRKARDPAFQAGFLAKSLAERRRAIVQMREKSKEVVQGKTAEIMDVNDDAVRAGAAPPRRAPPDPRPYPPAGPPRARGRRQALRALGAARLVRPRRLCRGRSQRPASRAFLSRYGACSRRFVNHPKGKPPWPPAAPRLPSTPSTC